jgi:hypothetical protein
MTLKQAHKVLSKHQKWRKGDERVKQTTPKELTQAMDIAIEVLNKILTK